MSDQHYILCIETATSTCSVSLSNRQELLGLREAREPNMHASALTVFIQELVADCGITFDSISAVAVSKGPGSYTGLRIGVSVAKGLCYALDIPLISVNSLLAMAQGYLTDNAELGKNLVLCPMIDARRMEVYVAAFDTHLKELEETKALIVDESSFSHWTKKGYFVVLFGTGADKLGALFGEHNEIEVVLGFQNSAAHMMPLAWQKYNNQSFEDIAYFEPFYLKDFVATTPKKMF
ncbi:tRNA (adenosine(37)-N6)-threonylcarbamoyltransferase complex dimerization subunit type 1 TsaB [Sphingobacterium sp. lm-10]|uniref:tRNA (adenosine(37)-N6)-threonylcarbamoyltransferase complex dimerization subunit type 1 TsaB n=1 Tax=Sphingobacterium sp. lm-10 TaxID=2944904 RepID=UPI00202273DD|nr:tRNA (adenosine(37)-N6)-threonylcarbamoyltransferase complex dimerization subunit type 1 TsaB [Sphingobacterium sp. lm-10]MCL7989050.1 tRNA (adenosine(37)-N6)-threonylcarbamoyltransferase complex dimerization subunit type 1 TsaB [Sphingobacterium sp. lm-10]